MTAVALHVEETPQRDVPRIVTDTGRVVADVASAGMAAPDTLNPYKGAQSYGPLDGDLFFGRDAEGAALARFLIGKPVSVLSAPSGIGKTSLLQAKVLPLLERESWRTVLARPHEDAIDSVLAAFAEHLLPDPAVEAGVIGRLAAEAGEGRSLNDALKWFLALPDSERIQRRLYVPPGHPHAGALPTVCRALRGSLDVLDLIEHFEAMVCYSTPLDLTPHTTLGDFAAGLNQPEVTRCWKEWYARFGAVRSLDALATLFEEEWAPLRPGLTGAVMVLDQFEEVFTLKKPGTIEALFERFDSFLERSTEGHAAKPMHLMFSLRKEFYADLVPHLRKFGPDEQLTYPLGAMPRIEASHALTEPAKMIGLKFASAGGGEPACVDGILAMALDEGTAERKPNEPLPDGPRYSPAFISLIGAHLRERLKENPDTPRPLTWSAFQRLIPQLDNVFGSFLEGALTKLEAMKLAHRTTRFDALELLDKLATASGYRNIMAVDSLMEQLPMRRAAAEELLNVLDFDLKLVRREGRRKAIFVEIMHERLIAPIRRLLAETRGLDMMRSSLAIAYELLYRLPDDSDLTRDPLPAQFRDALLTHRDRLELDHLAASHLLRSLLVAGPSAKERKRANFLADSAWAKAVRDLSQTVNQPVMADCNRAQRSTRVEAGKTIDDLDHAMQTGNQSWLRQIANSVLNDRSEDASSAVRRVFQKLCKVEAFT